MSVVLCVTDGLPDSEAWVTHLYMRGHDAQAVDLKTLASMKGDQWSRCALVIANASVKQFASDNAAFAAKCRALKADRIVLIDPPAPQFAIKGEFNGAVLKITPAEDGWWPDSSMTSRMWLLETRRPTIFFVWLAALPCRMSP